MDKKLWIIQSGSIKADECGISLLSTNPAINAPIIDSYWISAKNAEKNKTANRIKCDDFSLSSSPSHFVIVE